MYCSILISVGCSSILPLTIEGIAKLCAFIDCLFLYSIAVYTSRAILIIKSRASILDVFCRYSAYTKKLGFLRHFQFFFNHRVTLVDSQKFSHCPASFNVICYQDVFDFFLNSLLQPFFIDFYISSNIHAYNLNFYWFIFLRPAFICILSYFLVADITDCTKLSTGNDYIYMFLCILSGRQMLRSKLLQF